MGPPSNNQVPDRGQEVQVHFVLDQEASAGGNESSVAVTHSFTGKFYLCILLTQNIILHYCIITK